MPRFLRRRGRYWPFREHVPRARSHKVKCIITGCILRNRRINIFPRRVITRPYLSYTILLQDTLPSPLLLLSAARNNIAVTREYVNLGVKCFAGFGARGWGKLTINNARIFTEGKVKYRQGRVREMHNLPNCASSIFFFRYTIADN